MNLIVDVGNTFVKLAVFEQGKLIEKRVVESQDSLGTIKTLIREFRDIQKTIVSSVGPLDSVVYDFLSSKFDVLVLQSDTKIPFKNSYQTPHTLGVDRIALVSASVQQFPNNNVLIIDAGTAITYDFITSNNDYLGGAISPGVTLRYKALHNYTAKLPLLKTEMPEQLIGNTTISSMHSGVVNGVLKEIDGMIDAYHEKYEDLTVILTGGDANFLSKQLKNSIFANSNFLLEGLNFILEFNSH